MLELNEIAEAMRKAGRSEREIYEAINAIVDLQHIVMNDARGKAPANAPNH